MIKIIKYIFKTTISGFMFIINTICSGIYTILIGFFRLLNKIFKNKFDGPLNKLYGKEKPVTVLLVVFYIVGFTALFSILYTPGNSKVKHDKLLKDDVKNIEEVKDNKPEEVIETSLYKRFEKMSLNEVSIAELKKQNSDTVAWVSADGTNINYPVVQTSDNDYYLKHNFTKEYDINAWVFMDYRNNPGVDRNTIIYGHNLLNKTGFGSMSNFFTKDWKNTSSRTVVLLTENKEYIYKVFSIYYSAPVVDYLKVDFDNNDEFLNWINTLKSKDIMGLNEPVAATDKIITFSTCTENNKGRKVMQARLISEKDRIDVKK